MEAMLPHGACLFDTAVVWLRRSRRRKAGTETVYLLWKAHVDECPAAPVRLATKAGEAVGAGRETEARMYYLHDERAGAHTSSRSRTRTAQCGPSRRCRRGHHAAGSCVVPWLTVGIALVLGAANCGPAKPGPG